MPCPGSTDGKHEWRFCCPQMDGDRYYEHLTCDHCDAESWGDGPYQDDAPAADEKGDDRG